MVAVRVVQVAFDQVVHVVAVGDRLMTAVRPMNMRLPVRSAVVLRRASGGVRAAHVEHVVIDVIAVDVVQVAVVQVVGVPVVCDGDVAAAGAVLVIVPLVDLAILRSHGAPSSRCYGPLLEAGR